MLEPVQRDTVVAARPPDADPSHDECQSPRPHRLSRRDPPPPHTPCLRRARGGGGRRGGGSGLGLQTPGGRRRIRLGVAQTGRACAGDAAHPHPRPARQFAAARRARRAPRSDDAARADHAERSPRIAHAAAAAHRRRADRRRCACRASLRVGAYRVRLVARGKAGDLPVRSRSLSGSSCGRGRRRSPSRRRLPPRRRARAHAAPGRARRPPCRRASAARASRAASSPCAAPTRSAARTRASAPGRTGHKHEGQDILAASGTPVVAPLAGAGALQRLPGARRRPLRRAPRDQRLGHVLRALPRRQRDARRPERR